MLQVPKGRSSSHEVAVFKAEGRSSNLAQQDTPSNLCRQRPAHTNRVETKTETDCIKSGNKAV